MFWDENDTIVPKGLRNSFGKTMIT